MAEVLSRGHSDANSGGSWTELRNGIWRGRAAERRTIRGDVVGLAVGPLDIPGIRSHRDGVGFSVANIAILVTGRAEPASREGGVCSHFGEFVAGDLRPSLFLGLGQR